MSKPSLSIIIPLYNKVDYIERCVNSILHQENFDYELIIIDDGSTDGSDKLIRKYLSDKRVKLSHIPNSGVSAARNKGISEALGDFILFIDADDYIADGYLNSIMNCTRKNEADIYIWGITKDYINSRQIPIVPSLTGRYNREEFLSLFVKEQYQEHPGLYGYIPNKLLKRSIINEHQLEFNTSMKLMEDYDFFLRYYDHCQSFYCFEETGYHYVAYPSNSGKTKRSVNYLQLIDTHEKCINLLKENQAYTEQNETLLKKAIGGLALSAFLELKNISITAIKELLSKLRQRSYAISSLQSLKTDKNRLKHWILDQKAFLIYLYLLIWNSYLKIRTKK